MSRPVLAPLVVALSALLVVPQIQAEPTAPLFVVEQQRSALVARLAKQWSGDFALLPQERRLTHEQLSSALFALRADRLFAVTLAGDAEAVEAVLADAKREAAKPRVATKALGDATADLTYTPINPCRILDTRSTVAGPLTPNVARTFDGYSTNFATQGGTGSSCGIPSGVAALAMNVYAVNPTNLGFIKVWPANATEPDVSTVNYQVGITAIATGALVPVDAVNSNQFTAKSPATVDFIADVVGYFKPPGDATGLDIKVAGQRVMRYEYNAISPSVIGGSPANSVTSGVSGATIAGGGSAGIGANTVTAKYGSIGGGERNKVNGEGSTVGGGLMNTATSSRSVIAGGYGNSAIGLANTVSGGESNDASGLASVISGGDSNRTAGYYSSVGGGYNNWASADNSHIGGGQENRANQAGATICGGLSNLASGMVSTACGGSQNIANGHYSFIAGGTHNVASGYYSFAGGSFARTQTADLTPIVHNGAFVWAGANSTTFHSAAENEFAVRATGGVRFVTAIDGTGLPTWTCGVSGGAGGSWGCSSDRKLKTDLVPLDNVATLDRLAALPVYQWVAKDDPRRTPHAGPTAQDFMAAFGLGDNDKMIGFADAQGVLFSAVQGLNAKLVEKNGEIESLKAEMAEIRRAVEVLLTRTSPEGRVAERR
jgi:hypothetical protein